MDRTRLLHALGSSVPLALKVTLAVGSMPALLTEAQRRLIVRWPSWAYKLNNVGTLGDIVALTCRTSTSNVFSKPH